MFSKCINYKLCTLFLVYIYIYIYIYIYSNKGGVSVVSVMPVVGVILLVAITFSLL